MDLTDTIIPRSDQLNGDDLLTEARTVTIVDVRSGNTEQPVDIHLEEFPGRPFKPSKTVRRILVAAWGKEGDAYVGRRLTLYRDPDVRFGGQDVGGIRVSHMSHIAKPLKLALTVSKGKKAPHVIQPLAEPAQARTAKPKAPTDNVDTGQERDGITSWQLRRLAAELRDAGLNDAEAGLAYITQTVGRDITSSRDLTRTEADKVINALAPEPTIDGTEQ